MKRSIWKVQLCWWWALLGSSALVGQTPTELDSLSAANQPIPLPRLAEEFGNATLYLRNSVYPELRNPLLAELAPSVDSLKADVRALQGISNYVWEQQVATRISSGLANKWRGFYRQVLGLERQLSVNSNAIEAQRDELSRLQLVWSLTQATLPKNIPVAINERIDTLQQQLFRADSILAGRFNELLSIQNRVLDVKLMVQLQLDNMALLEQQELQSLLSSRRDPLPSLSWRGKPALAANNYRKVALDYFRTELAEFLRNNPDRMYLHLLIFVGLALFFFLAKGFLQPHSPPRPPQEFNLASEVLFTRPLILAFLLALLLSPMLYTNRPAIFNDLLVLGLAIPFVAVIPRFVVKPVRWSIYLIGILFFLHLTLKAAIINQVIFRWFLLMESLLLGIFFFLNGFREREWFRQRQASGSFFRIMQVGAPFGLVIATMAALGNLSGYDTLAEVFNLALEQILLLGLILYSAALVLEGLLQLALAYRSQETERGNARSSWPQMGKWLRRLAGLSWFALALVYLQLFDPVYALIGKLWQAGFSFGAYHLSLGAVLEFLIIFGGALLLGRGVQALVEEEILPRFKLERGVPRAIGVSLRYALYAGGLLLALNNAGLSLERLSWIIGALAIGAGMGLQGFVANFLAGLRLVFTRNLAIGDTLIIAGQEGILVEIGLHSSKIKLPDGGLLFLPNAVLVHQKMIHHPGGPTPRRQQLDCSTPLTVDSHKVINRLLGAAHQSEGILTTPEPSVVLLGPRAGRQTYRLYFWTHQSAGAEKSRLLLTISEIWQQENW